MASDVGTAKAGISDFNAKLINVGIGGRNVAHETDHSSDQGGPSQTQIFLSSSISVLAWTGSAILGLGGLVIRLWTSSIEDDVRAIRGDLAQHGKDITVIATRESETSRDIWQLRREVDDHEQRIRWHQADGHSHGKERHGP